MTLVHSPWPLFSDDLDFAQSWMRDQLNRFPMTSEAGHTALNIGLRDEVEQHLTPSQRRSSETRSIPIPLGTHGWRKKPLPRTHPQLPPQAMSAALLQRLLKAKSLRGATVRRPG